MRRLTSVVRTSRIGLVAALLFLSLGCGGGGGGSTIVRFLGDSCPLGSNPGSVEYRTTWGAGTPSLASQVLQILDVDGNVVFTFAINRQGLSVSTLSIGNVTPGVYEFKATLYSQENAQGIEIGTTSQVVDLCGNTVNVRTTAALPPFKIKVSPGSADITEQQSRRFVATVQATTGESVFVQDGSITWSVLGGIGTVDQTGLFTATTEGDGSVRAAISSPSLSAAAVVHVSDFVIVQTKWTVLVYINAANDLYWASDLNVNQMEEVADNPDVRFVLQWKQSRDLFSGSSFDGVRRVLVKPDTSGTVVSEVVQSGLTDGQGQPLDMGIPQTLKDFLDWAKTYYPADRYALVIWNHGNGWRLRPEAEGSRAFSYDDQTGNSIQIWECDEALAGHTFDIIAWDASLMQMMEVAYEIRDKAPYIVGSEESPPAEGYPYHLVFSAFRDNPDETTANLTKAFIDGTLAYPPYTSRKITQSSLESSTFGPLRDSISALATALINAYTADPSGMAPRVQNVRANAKSYSPTSVRFYRDLVDLCLKLEAEPGMPLPVMGAAANVRAQVALSVLWEGHNDNSLGSNGVSIDFSPASVFGSVSANYLQMKFAADSQWDEWLSIAP
jgi:hypothetical protein